MTTGGSTLPFGLTDETWAISGFLPGYLPDGGPKNVRHVAAGTVSGGAYVGLPSDEEPMASTGGRVASMVWGPLTSDFAVANSTLIVRDVLAGGRLLAQTVQPGAVFVVALGRQVAFFGTHLPTPDPQIEGVYALSLADGTVRTLVSPSTGPQVAGRLGLLLSPNERTLSSSIDNGGGRNAEVIHLDTGIVTHFAVGDSRPVLTTDAVLLVSGSTQLSAYDLASGQQMWEVDDIWYQRGYATADGTAIVVQTGDNGTRGPANLSNDAKVPAISRINVATGSRETLLAATGPGLGFQLWPAVSNDRVAVLLPGGFPPADAMFRGNGSITISVLALDTASLTPLAFTIAAAQ